MGCDRLAALHRHTNVHKERDQPSPWPRRRLRSGMRMGRQQFGTFYQLLFLVIPEPILARFKARGDRMTGRRGNVWKHVGWASCRNNR
jgi:hypothetical protein